MKEFHATSPKRKKNTMETVFWGGKGYFSRFRHKEEKSMPLLTISTRQGKKQALQHTNAQLLCACKVFGRTTGNIIPIHPTLRI
jgi:hypothetical protein